MRHAVVSPTQRSTVRGTGWKWISRAPGNRIGDRQSTHIAAAIAISSLGGGPARDRTDINVEELGYCFAGLKVSSALGVGVRQLESISQAVLVQDISVPNNGFGAVSASSTVARDPGTST